VTSAVTVVMYCPSNFVTYLLLLHCVGNAGICLSDCLSWVDVITFKVIACVVYGGPISQDSLIPIVLINTEYFCSLHT